MQIGIVGLPNVGKSTLFKALTKKQVDIANYPFCTIDPNIGVVEVPDARLDKLAALYNSAKIIHAHIEFVDIAGLVKNAHQGEGLGNQFLSHIREVDAIAHVVRNFHDDNITHVEGKIDPSRDLEIIHLELAMADLDTLHKTLTRLKDRIKSSDKESIKLQTLLEPIKAALDKGQKPDTSTLTPDELKLIKGLGLLTLKPGLIIENISEETLAHPTNTELPIHFTEFEQAAHHQPPTPIIPICAKLESDLTELSESEIVEYLKELNIQQTGHNQLITQSYQLLNLITFFTAGPKEAHAWTIYKDTKAPQAAGKIHTDFEKGFIRAEVINWQKLIQIGGDVKAKEKGLVKDQGKDYTVQDGDVIVVKFAK